MKAKIAIAFLLGTLVGQTLLGIARAGGSDGWTFRDIQHTVRLLERIEQNTRR